jgi:hypothetical protein
LNSIRDILTEAARRGQSDLRTVLAVVDEVHDDHTCDVTPLGDSVPIVGVRLQAGPGLTEGWVLRPAPGSLVAVTMLSDAEAVISLTSELEQAYLKVGDMAIRISNNALSLEGGRWQALEAEIRVISDLLGAIKQMFASWVPVPMDGGAALKALSAQLTTYQLPTVQFLDNPTIEP